MSVSLDLPDDLVEDSRLRAKRDGRGLEETAADLLRSGLAASAASPSALRADASMLEGRTQIAKKFLSGEWGTELAGFESGRRADRHAGFCHGRSSTGSFILRAPRGKP